VAAVSQRQRRPRLPAPAEQAEQWQEQAQDLAAALRYLRAVQALLDWAPRGLVPKRLPLGSRWVGDWEK
jgi:hypothetical protein